jgi:hypothetical protein
VVLLIVTPLTVIAAFWVTLLIRTPPPLPVWSVVLELPFVRVIAPPPLGLAIVVWAKAGVHARPAAIRAVDPSRPIRMRRCASAPLFERAGEREPATGRLLEADM